MPSAGPVGTAPLLSVQDLKVHFHIGGGLLSRRRAAVLKAVDGVTFDLRPGETLGLVGESGCGKSTLGRAVLRLLPTAAGRVVWLGQDLALLSHEAMRQKRQQMQIVFQDPLAALNPRMTVGDIIAEPMKTFQPNLPATETKKRVQEIMAKVGLLPNQINRYPHEFSGGQCQRIGIARAMINSPQLIVCDEPVSALDVSIQAQIVNLLMDLQRDMGMALIFISHNLSVVRHISHRIMVLYLGRVAELADRDELYRNPRHPYTQALISAVPIPDPDVERNRRRVVLTGDLPSPLKPPSGCTFRTRCPKATELCTREVPPLETIGRGHEVACHHWDQQ
ncbi:MAG TPA: dipeptide ABC transporter ATP-binding protein [Candidatus Angelobacter sp.]|nr:dipeptide ABC transporter ATP-binding protein [Candidatus Angelobacter sp.]